MSLTVTFHNIDNPQRSIADLQLLVIFCHLSANSSRTRAQASYMQMINYLDSYVGGSRKKPFDIIKKIIADGKLDQFIREGVGASRVQAARKFFQSLVTADIDLKTVSRDELMKKVKGIGPAKASLFVMYRDQNWGGVVVDKGVQEWMREQFNSLGMADKAALIPQEPIRNKRDYQRAERAFLEIAQAKGQNPRQLNVEILKQFEGETKFDRADERRIKKGGKSTASHWDSRISRNDISLPF